MLLFIFSYFLGHKIDRVMSGGAPPAPPAYRLSILCPKKYKNTNKSMKQYTKMGGC